MAVYVEAFRALAENDAMVIGVGRSGQGRPRMDDYANWLSARGLRAPVFSVDVRRLDDVLLLIDALLNQIETRRSLAHLPSGH
jgi:hypothetical protein